ncbi:MAG: 16S rRNA (cytosine(967)-C(5))-methyltransferase RsmB [Clostridia bacterium]|nr:16S rRNA (cytosine(967)-C(5))-methyltransferase RsmB [Clostridia bacterium]
MQNNKFPKGRPGTGRPAPARPAQGKPYGKPEVKGGGANPRLVAVNVVCDVLENEAYAALSLDDRLSGANLSLLDRRLCASIVYRTLENLYSIDFALSGFLRDADALSPQARAILRTAACQILLHDRVPDSAAVNEAVKVSRALGLEGLSGMINAVLRRLAEGKERIAWPKPEDGARYLSVMYSLPEWLAQRLVDDYGADEALKIASFRTERHFVTLRPTYGREKEFAACLSRKVWESAPGVMPGAVRVFGAAQIARDSDFLSGVFSIQGEGSMLAAEAVGAKRGMSILDCCAAPGGKTAYLAERLEGTGRVYAWDLHAHRVELIRAMTRRLHLDNVRMAPRDAMALRDDIVGAMDAVLLDAPCTGLGVMDDKPDVKYRHTAESVVLLCDTQAKLLDTCCRYVRPGGTLVYSTCSMLKDENERQIARFLAAHPEFRIAPLPATIPEALRAQAGSCGLQLLPHRDGIEGFFVARMERAR